MKNKIIASGVIALLLTFNFVSSATAEETNTSAYAFKQNKKLGRGLNILSADPMWVDPINTRMTNKHFKEIKKAGFNNVRIAIHPFKFATEKENFTLDPKFFVILDWAVKQSLENKLMPIIDLHEHHEMQRDPIGNKKIFLAMWKQIAMHYKKQPKEVVFEIGNEPNMKPEIWNDLQEEARKIIRQSNPKRTLLIGTINGNQIEFLKDLKLPEDDRNIIVAIHYYLPIQFTHQGAHWSKKNKDLKDIPWNATEEEQVAIIKDFDIAQAWSKQHNRPLTLGEFGAYDKADMKHRQIWTDFIARQAEARNWSWTYWQFDSDFIAYDIDNDQWVTPIKDSLIPTGKK